jgi:hypothetical protein
LDRRFHVLDIWRPPMPFLEFLLLLRDLCLHVGYLFVLLADFGPQLGNRLSQFLF